MNLYVMKAAMRQRPYLLNQGALPPGYWQEFFSEASNRPWTPPNVSIERSSARLGDVLGWIGGVPLFSKAATDFLINATQGRLQFALFGEIKAKPYWIMSRVPIVADLDPESVASCPAVFCLPGKEMSEVLVKESIPEQVVSLKLTGFEFRKLGQPHLKALFKGESVNAYPGVLP